ncbi:MAG: hypothetical protein K0S86_4140, partial [Geminicoccaceae bacterium]|nr:hypothetical protein [Geminicoccaceae bacterium]
MRRPHVTRFLPLSLLVVFAAACTDDAEPIGPAHSPADLDGTAALVGPSPIGSPVPIGVEVIADGFVSP